MSIKIRQHIYIYLHIKDLDKQIFISIEKWNSLPQPVVQRNCAMMAICLIFSLTNSRFFVSAIQVFCKKLLEKEKLP